MSEKSADFLDLTSLGALGGLTAFAEDLVVVEEVEVEVEADPSPTPRRLSLLFLGTSFFRPGVSTAPALGRSGAGEGMGGREPQEESTEGVDMPEAEGVAAMRRMEGMAFAVECEEGWEGVCAVVSFVVVFVVDTAAEAVGLWRDTRVLVVERICVRKLFVSEDYNALKCEGRRTLFVSVDMICQKR